MGCGSSKHEGVVELRRKDGDVSEPGRRDKGILEQERQGKGSLEQERQNRDTLEQRRQDEDTLERARQGEDILEQESQDEDTLEPGRKDRDTLGQGKQDGDTLQQERKDEDTLERGRKDGDTLEQERQDADSSTKTIRPLEIQPIVHYKGIDEHAKKAPDNVTIDITTLADYLTSPYQDDLHKTRAIFAWLAFNITYDVAVWKGDSQQPQNAENVLRSRKAVCQGYAELCLALCRAANVECRLVSGFAKGAGHSVNSVYTEDMDTNHAWNHVRLQGEWRPLECTWGAGHVDKSGQFNREFADHWFLTDPEEFLPTHFPYMNRDMAASLAYQLVSQPIDLQTFSDMVKPEGAALKIGLQFITHAHTVIEVLNDVTIKVKVKSGRPSLESVMAFMAELTSLSADSSAILASLEDDGTCCVYVKPPKAGKYRLQIFGRTGESPEGSSMHMLVEYLIHCTRQRPSSAPSPFPAIRGMWGWKQPLATECGLKRVKNAPFMFSAKNGEVAVPVPFSRRTNMSSELFHADNMQSSLKQYTFIECTDDGAVVSARLPRPGYYMLQLFAARFETENLPQVADLLLFSSEEISDCLPFPLAYTFALKHDVRLIEPRSRKVKAGVKTLFRVQAPALAKVKVGNIYMTLRNGCWEAEVTPEADVCIFGATDPGAGSTQGLFKFDVL